MAQTPLANIVAASEKKIGKLERNPLGYVLSSGLAGIYVGLGILLILTVGSFFQGAPYAKMVQGLSFGIALSLVVAAGAELFTGNNLVMSFGALAGRVSWGRVVKLWIVCWIGNLLGSILLGFLFAQTGLVKDGLLATVTATATAKASAPLMALFVRGMLCNLLVCLAIWCSFTQKEEVAKLIMVFWCLYAFITMGLEHSVANMTVFALAYAVDAGVSVSAMGMNLLVVSLGNLLGAVVLLVLPYWIGRERD